MLVNGKSVSHISVEDRGLLYGDGLFETILCEQGQPVLFDEHIRRLQKGCKKLHICIPDKDLIHSELLECAQQSNCVIKIIITRGVRPRGYQYDPNDQTSTRVVYRNELTDIPLQYYSSGIRLHLCRHRLPDNVELAGLKHLNRLDQVIASSEWTQEFEEGITLDQRDYVIEGTMSNVFFESEGKWITPKLDSAGVEGIMRNFILQNASEFSMQCEQSTVTLQQLDNADAIFVCNSVIGVWPVKEFHSKKYSVSDSTRRLMQYLHFNVSSLYKPV